MKKANLKPCSNCEVGHLYIAVRDVTVKRQKLSATVRGIVGAFCDHCDEIEFDGTTDSAQRYAQAGHKLVLPGVSSLVVLHQARPLQTRSFHIALFHMAVAFDELWNARYVNRDAVVAGAKCFEQLVN